MLENDGENLIRYVVCTLASSSRYTYAQKERIKSWPNHVIGNRLHLLSSEKVTQKVGREGEAVRKPTRHRSSVP
jgi:phage gp46-like protein